MARSGWGKEYISSGEEEDMKKISSDELAMLTEEAFLKIRPTSKRNVRQEVLDFLNSGKNLPDDLIHHLLSAKSDYSLKHSSLIAPSKKSTTADVKRGTNPITYETTPPPLPTKRRENYEL